MQEDMTDVALSERVNRPRWRLSLSTSILLGMVAGIVAGILFGEYMAPLGLVGNGFVKLLQMTILPYIFVSLIGGIGSLTFDKAKTLTAKAGLILLVYWVISFVFVLLMPLAFPEWESASFFSSALVETPKPVDFLDLYIPANPFKALSDNLVPAVVLFSISVGVALIGMRDKGPLLDLLDTLSHTLVKIAGFVVKLTPLGVFAIAASAAGTMTVDEISKLQVYLITFTVASLILAFWLLPMLVAVATPFRYRDIVGVSRDALVTAFTTGNLFVVLTVLTEASKALFGRYEIKSGDTDAYVDIIIPVSFNFPNAGKLIMLLFVLFAAWFVGSDIGWGEYPQFVVSGLLSFFGGVDVALPFMLDQMRLPSDLYQLYVVTGIVNGRTATLLAAMNLLTFTLLATAALTGHLVIRWRNAIAVGVATLAMTVAVLLAMRWYFSTAVDNAFDKAAIINEMESPIFPGINKVYSEVPDLPQEDPAKPLLQRILERGVLRVGYSPASLPFSYMNDEGRLVGYDVDMAVLLAHDLGVKPVFIPVDLANLSGELAKVPVDIVMAGVVMTPDRLKPLRFSDPYMEVSAALVVPDHLRKAFTTVEAIKRMKGLTIGVFQTGGAYFVERVKELFPNAQVVVLDSTTDFFYGNDDQVDVLVQSAEAGSAWTLRFPEYSVVVPEPVKVKWPLAYPLRERDQGFENYVDRWIDLVKGSMERQILYDHWILGLTARPERPRWSVVRDVLHWVD